LSRSVMRGPAQATRIRMGVSRWTGRVHHGPFG
jgi:hypothetical protein